MVELGQTQRGPVSLENEGFVLLGLPEDSGARVSAVPCKMARKRTSLPRGETVRHDFYVMRGT